MCFDRNLVQWSGAVWQGFSARASGVCAQKKWTSDQQANETFNRQGLYVNNALLRSWISAVSCQSNSTAVSRVVHYIETEARTVTDRKCAVARYNDISKSKHSYCHYLVYMSSSDEDSIIRIFVQINILERRASYVVLMGRVSISISYSSRCLTTETVKYINENRFIENQAASKYSMWAQRGKHF